MVKKIKAGNEAQKLIWRISPEHPHGVFILASIRRVKPARSSEAHDRGFSASSFELLNGAEVTETSPDTLEGELSKPFPKDTGPP